MRPTRYKRQLRYRKFLLFAWGTPWLLMPALGLTEPVQAPLFERIILEASQESPLIRAQSDLLVSYKDDRLRRFVPNSPQLQVTDSDDHSAQSFGVSLTAPFPGKSFAFRKVDHARVESAKAELTAKRIELVRLVAQEYLDCASQIALTRLQEESARDLSSMREMMKALYESGHSTQAERIAAELQVRQALSDLDIAKDKASVSCRYLEVLAPETRVNRESLSIPDDISTVALEKLGSQSADELRSDAQIKVADVTTQTANWNLAPDLTFSATNNHYLRAEASPAGKEWTNTYSLSLSFPLFFPFNENSDLRKAKAQAASDRATAELALLKAHSEREDAAREFQRSRRRLKEISENDLVLARALVESTLSAYRLGKLGFAELLFSRKTMTDLKIQEIQLKAALINARLRCLSSCDAYPAAKTNPNPR